jgi:YVTN family beta-propeller protein
MANKDVFNVKDVTETLGGLAVADRPARPGWLPTLQELRDGPARSLRAHLQRLPESAPAVPEAPLIETDTAPGFSSVQQITVGRGPIGAISIDPRDGLVYVANPADDSIAVLDPAKLSVVSVVTGTSEPFALAARRGRAFVSTVDGAYDTLTVVDTAGLPAQDADPAEPVDYVSYPVALSVRDLAVSPDGRYVYLARTGRTGADLAIVDTASGQVFTVDLRTRPSATAEAVTVSADGRRVYVVTADHVGGEFIAVDTVTRRVVDGLAFRAPLRDVVAGPGTTVFVVSYDAVTGGVIDLVDTRTHRVVDSIEVGGPVSQLVVSSSGARLYVVNGDRITVVCPATHEIVDTITVVGEPSCIAESADGKWLFIAGFDGEVTALRVASTTESLPAGRGSAVIDVPMLELELV